MQNYKSLLFFPVILFALCGIALGQLEDEGSPAKEDEGSPAVAETGDWTTPEKGKEGKIPIRIGLSLGPMLGFSDFEAETISDEYYIRGAGAFDFKIVASYDLPENFGVMLAPEINIGSGDFSWVIALFGTYRIDAFKEVSVFKRGFLTPRLGFCLGGYNANEMPGSFSPGFGFEFGAELETGLDFFPEYLSVFLELDFRYLWFSFKPDAQVLKSDDGYGGFGAVLGFGVKYAF